MRNIEFELFFCSPVLPKSKTHKIQFQQCKYFLWFILSLWLICLMDELLIDMVGDFSLENETFPASLHLILYPFIEITVQKLNISTNKCFLLKFYLNFLFCLFSGKWMFALNIIISVHVYRNKMSLDSTSLSLLLDWSVCKYLYILCAQIDFWEMSRDRPRISVRHFEWYFWPFGIANQTTSI